MNIGRFVLIASCVTSMMIGYVHQNVASVQLAYSLRDYQHQLEDLVDRSTLLRYNLASITAPTYIEDRLRAQEQVLARPQMRTSLHLAKNPVDTADVFQSEHADRSALPNIGMNVLNLFIGSAEAQAQTR